MDVHTFDREMSELCGIGQDPDQRPVSLATPAQKFAVAVPDLSQSTALYTEMIGETPDSFLRSVKNAYQEKATTQEVARLDKVTDLSDDNNLRKSGRPSRIPDGFEAQCLLCNKDFRTVAELRIHDRESVELHKIIG